jgi:GNAT superfamily N-acetyltransferase
MFSELAARLPDLPRWVETLGMRLSGPCDPIVPPGPGLSDAIVRGTDFGLFRVSGEPPLAALSPALARHGGKAVLCALERTEALSSLLPGWIRSQELIHALKGAEPSERLGRLSTALGFSHVAAAFVDDLPVSFCDASYETETLWDLSIDTLEGYRGRGLAARACCEFLIGHMARRGKRPVWGALEENTPSIRMAANLGFVPVDTLAIFRPEAAA